MKIRTIVGTFRPRISIRTLLIAIAVIAVVFSVTVQLWSYAEFARRTSASNRLLEPIITYHWLMGGQYATMAGALPRSGREIRYHERMRTYYSDLLRDRCLELPPLPAPLEAERRAIEAERRAAWDDPTYVLLEPPKVKRGRQPGLISQLLPRETGLSKKLTPPNRGASP